MQGTWQQITEADGLCSNSPRFVGRWYIGTDTTAICYPDFFGSDSWINITVPLGTSVYAMDKFPPGGGELWATDEGIIVNSDIGWELDYIVDEYPYNEEVYVIKGVRHKPVLMLKDTIVYENQTYLLTDVVGSADVSATCMATIIRNERFEANKSAYDEEIWVGTDGAGLIRIFPEPARHHTTANRLPSNEIRDIAISDNVWVATSNGVGKWDGTSWTTYRMSDGLPSNDINGIVEYRDIVWVATSNGAAYFNGQEWQSFTTADGLPISNLTDVRYNGARSIWFTTEDSGLVIFTITNE